MLLFRYENLSSGIYPLGLHKVDVRSNVDKKKEIKDAAKRLIVQERKLIHNEEDDSEEDEQTNSLYSKKVLKKKKKAMQKKKLAWEVSQVHESNESETGNKPEANASWEVTEATGTNKINVTNAKKRKQNKEPNLDQITSNSKLKKTKVTEFSVTESDSKENSFSSPVSSTPIHSASKPVLAKTTTNSQNIQNGSAKKLKILKKSLGNDTSEVNTSASPGFNELNSENEKGTPVTTKNILKKAKDTTLDKTPELVLNTSTKPKNNGWGGEWEEPLQEGEYEIFIPNKKYVTKRKSLGLPYPVSSFVQKSAEKSTPIKKFKVSTLLPLFVQRLFKNNSLTIELF